SDYEDFEDSDLDDSDLDDSDLDDSDLDDSDLDDSDYEDFEDSDLDDSDLDDSDLDDSDYEDLEYDDPNHEHSIPPEYLEALRNYLNGTSDLKPLPSRMSEMFELIKNGIYKNDYSGTVFGPSIGHNIDFNYNIIPKDISSSKPIDYISDANYAPAAYTDHEDDSKNMTSIVPSNEKDDAQIVRSVSKKIVSSMHVNAVVQAENINSDAPDNQTGSNNQPADNSRKESTGFNYYILALLVIVVVGIFAAYKKFN
ncbi:pentapeptide repeat-containing protein, partial [Methanobrevibacter sp.]|uniref:pentapeptide repeat-containing protein n=1 Tax=Methanobrevibacter sp. TaxID=66852 RepID=UPI0025D4A97D